MLKVKFDIVLLNILTTTPILLLLWATSLTKNNIHFFLLLFPSYWIGSFQVQIYTIQSICNDKCINRRTYSQREVTHRITNSIYVYDVFNYIQIHSMLSSVRRSRGGELHTNTLCRVLLYYRPGRRYLRVWICVKI